MRERRARLAALVDERVDGGTGRRLGASRPRLGDQVDLLVRELCQRPAVLRGMDDDFLSRECRVEVRRDADAPARGVRRLAGRKDERLGWGAVLASLAERTRLELLLRRRLGGGA